MRTILSAMLNVIPEISGLFLGIVGLFTISFGSYFYISSGFGAGPKDSLMVGIKRKTKLNVGLCRGIIEASVVLAGWALGGPVGIGTVIAAFGIGLCIQIVFNIMKFAATSVRHETLDATYKSFNALCCRKERS